jgi:hypothetical protein
MPNIFNIGITWTEPKKTIENINELPGLWQPPTPYKCEFAKRVLDVESKKNTIHKILSQFRINPKQRFFHVPIEKVLTLFDLMDGDNWVNNICDSDDICDIPVINTDNILEKNNRQLTILNEILEKREKEVKVIEEKMLDCLFQKCNNLEAKIENKKVELSEINVIIEERKSALKYLANNSNTTVDQYQNNKYILTE